MKMVLAHRSHPVRRQWFDDARDDGRRMEVSTHSDEGIVIVSLWHGSICRATFRLPVDEAPALIQTLADASADTSADAAQPAPSPGRTSRPTSLVEMGRDRLRRHVAEVVALEDRPKH